MQTIIDCRDRMYPGEGRKILFCAPSNTDTGDRTANIANIRTWIAQVVAAAGGEANGLKVIDWSQAFALNATATADTNIKSSERTAGNRLHPSGIGSATLGQYTFDQAKTFLFGLT